MNPRTTIAAAGIACCLIATGASADRFHPNSIKYKDTGIQNAKGTSGSASIEARALLNANETTDVEVTTGAFDGSSAASGTIQKMKIEVPAATDTKIPKNYNSLDDSLVSVNVSGPVRHDSLDIEAYVRADSGTEKIAITETVKKRPDLGACAAESKSERTSGFGERRRSGELSGKGLVGRAKVVEFDATRRPHACSAGFPRFKLLRTGFLRSSDADSRPDRPDATRRWSSVRRAG